MLKQMVRFVEHLFQYLSFLLVIDCESVITFLPFSF